jgi:cytochrome c biogenesis protein CcmG/thiol:disulfide interchange protein DsbE
MKALKVGDAALPFSLPNLEGEPVGFDPVAPELKVLVFYKNSCPTCQLAMPYFNRLAGQQDIATPQMYAISQDTPEEARAFAEEFGITMTHLVDDKPHQVSRDYRLFNVPTLLLIDQDGTIELISPAFVRDHIEQTVQRLALAKQVPVPAIFTSDDDVPQLKPG